MGTFLKIRLPLMVGALAIAATVFFASGVAEGFAPRPRTEIACLQHGEFRYFSRPASCDFFARQYFPNGLIRRYRDIGTKHMKWTAWGKPIAIGVGLSELAVPITVVASDQRRCPDGRWYYGKVFTHSSVGHDQHLRLARCGAKRFPPLKASDFPPPEG
jgi:hypothetical protein